MDETLGKHGLHRLVLIRGYVFLYQRIFGCLRYNEHARKKDENQLARFHRPQIHTVTFLITSPLFWLLSSSFQINTFACCRIATLRWGFVPFR